MSYFDTSVVVAYYIPEALSDQVQRHLASDLVATVSELTQLEFVSALALRHRVGDLSYADARRISHLFASHLDAGLYRTLHLDAAAYQLASDYIARFDLPLKAPDALHLAIASIEAIPLITADQQLARNAEALGLSVEMLVPES